VEDAKREVEEKMKAQFLKELPGIIEGKVTAFGELFAKESEGSFSQQIGEVQSHEAERVTVLMEENEAVLQKAKEEKAALVLEKEALLEEKKTDVGALVQQKDAIVKEKERIAQENDELKKRNDETQSLLQHGKSEANGYGAKLAALLERKGLHVVKKKNTLTKSWFLKDHEL